MINARKKRHGAIEVADPNLGGAGVEIERAFFVDLALGIRRGKNLDADLWSPHKNDRVLADLRPVVLEPGDVNGLDAIVTPSLNLIQEWRDQLAREEWEESYRHYSAVLPERGRSDYRWLFENDLLWLEVRHWNETSFRRIRSEELQMLRNNYRHDTSGLCPDAVPLVTEHLQYDGYSCWQKISVTGQV